MKKPSVFSFLITLLLAAAVCIQGREPVKDTDGNSLMDRTKYFIKPANNNGGGLVPAAINILPFCPLGITQTLLPYQPGLPVSFHLPIGGKPPVSTSLPVSIDFKSDIWPVCTEFSKFWKVDDSPSASEEPAVLIGGKRFDENSHFKIEKAGEGEGSNTYKLTTSYGTVGAIPGGWIGALQLIVTNDTAKTLLVKFNKVDDATTTSTSRVEKLGLRMFPFY
ncbi:PREDICTED: cysteine protease inhibitor WSCP-like [Camelina sativa]|uniref:Cysteine protease inhibitor WSCP-like n=1 Tax=Camelina sativa TaxID=90675 RepID=A0ABM0TLF1_CAMSA|nr:PREDICTED: cysteine protease inhibitor WSCP-like [Camelina sativa]